MRTAYLFLGGALAIPSIAAAQITVTGVSTTATQAILQYDSPVQQACSVKVADMNRAISIVSGAQSSGTVTITTKAPHGLLPGAVVFLESTGAPAWEGWQTVGSAPASTTFTFANPTAGTSRGGVVGVLVDDVNATLYTGADQDSRAGNILSGYSRAFVVGHRDAPIALDGNRYTQALQANSRHHYTLKCGSDAVSGDFSTTNPPLGSTHNDGLPVDRGAPGQYAYPNIQWSNPAQALIDPLTGLRSFRSSGPAGTPSTTQTFATALDPTSAWKNPSGPLASWGSVATFSGPCSSGSCALLLRADNLTLGAASYSGGISSLDWVAVTVSNASSTSPCSGDDCKIVACLTVNGVSCASSGLEIALTTTPATYTLGTRSLMDLWQGSGPPAITSVDVSQASGTVTYTASSNQVTLVSGSAFNIKWGAGSQIKVAGSWYTIAAVRNENQLTLSSGPSSNLAGAPYSANNFGVLIRKKTPAANTVSIGYTTFQYGSSPMGTANTIVEGACSQNFVVVGGVNGYNCFVATELYWVAANGSDVRDLGKAVLGYPSGYNGWCGYPGGSSFDPLNGDIWYCLAGTSDNLHNAIVQSQYLGNHATGTPGVGIPFCANDGNVQPCINLTTMTLVDVSGPAFSAAYRASGYNPPLYGWGWSGSYGVGDDIAIRVNEGAQDTKGWIFIYTLGDRTPYGTDANSFRPIAATSTYQTAPFSWCKLHEGNAPDSGWISPSFNDLDSYVTTLTSATLNITPSAAGGLNTCPTNSLGVTGQTCTHITVSGEPASGGVTLQPIQVGDTYKIDRELLRVVVKNSPTDLWVQRGYAQGGYGYWLLQSHAGTSLAMSCGCRTPMATTIGLWDYQDDPYGANATGTTLLPDLTAGGGHGVELNGVGIDDGGSWWQSNPQCDTSVLGPVATCYQIRHGHVGDLHNSPLSFVGLNLPFAGALGFGNPNAVDSHTGWCSGPTGWCLDSRPMLGNDGASGTMVGSAGSPFVNVAGQLWKYAGGAGPLNRKLLATMAYVGGSPLVDVSGPRSSIPLDSTGSYEYCHALTAGECRPDSSAGDLYVNAPYVSYPYCYYPGIGSQPGDANGICMGDLGSDTGYLVQVGIARQDLFGTLSRRIGTNYSRWNRMAVFWVSYASPAGEVLFSNAPWLDGVRTDNLISVPAPYPAPDSTPRATFVPVTIQKDAPPADLMVHDVAVEFGYAENGDPGSFYCTSRQESCVAVSGAISPSTPFFYEQSETYSGAACSAGCTVAIPALSQRVLYYRWKYRDAFGKVIATSDIRATATP
jgi:hypothetical protein